MKLRTYTLGSCVVLAAVAASAQAPATTTPEPEKQPKWESSAGLGLILTEGNSRTLQINGSIQSSKKWNRNEINLGADGTYGEDRGDKNAESLRGYGQYNRLFTDRTFGYLRLEALHDAIADIDYRISFSPGIGYYFIKNDRTFLRGEVGPGLIHEKVGGEEDTYMTLRLAERFEHKINDRARIWQSLELLPQVDDWENFIINAEIGIESDITKSLSQRTYVQDTYDNEPAPGRRENDLKLVAAIVYKF